MNIPEKLQKPHVEINEDGKEFQHPGYYVAKCYQCGQECMAAVGAVSPSCGRHDGGAKT
jgi:hypothetical protein